MKKEFIQKPSVYVYYIIGIVWLVIAFTIGFYKPYHYLLMIVFSILLFIGLSKILPKENIEALPKPVESKDEYCALILKDGYSYMEQLANCKKQLENQELIDRVEHIEDYGNKILVYISQHVEASRDVRKFINYYFPTLLSLLKNYDELENEHADTKVVQGGMETVSKVMPLFEQAFQEQYDSLFQNKVLDINAQTSVIQTMLKQDGFDDDHLTGGTKDGK